MDSPEVFILDLRSNKVQGLLEGHLSGNFAVKFVDDNYVFTGGEDGFINYWDIRQPQ